MSTQFFQEVKTHFHFLIDENGFSIRDQVGPAGFGHYGITYQTQNCFLDVMLDSGKVYVEFHPRIDPQQKYDVSEILAFLLHKSERWWFYPDENLSVTLKSDEYMRWLVAEVAQRLRPYINQILRLFEPDVYKEKEEALRDYIAKLK